MQQLKCALLLFFLACDHSVYSYCIFKESSIRGWQHSFDAVSLGVSLSAWKQNKQNIFQDFHFFNGSFHMSSFILLHKLFQMIHFSVYDSKVIDIRVIVEHVFPLLAYFEWHFRDMDGFISEVWEGCQLERVPSVLFRDW